MTPRRRNIAILVAILVIVGGAALLVLPSLSDTVDSGHDLRPYESGEVYEVRVADAITVYADEETRDGIGTDLFSGMALVILATAAAITALLLTAVGAARKLRLFYGIAAAGLGFLALDELLALHETIGHNLPFLADLPGVERPDDMVFAAYLIPAIAFVLYFRDVLSDSRTAVRAFIAAVVLFALTGLFDVTGSMLDEPMEILVAVAIVVGLVALMIEHLTVALRLPIRERARVASGA